MSLIISEMCRKFLKESRLRALTEYLQSITEYLQSIYRVFLTLLLKRPGNKNTVEKEYLALT